MKKELQRNVNGVTSGGGSIQHPLSIHSASIGSRWKLHGLSLMMTILLLFTMGIGQMWGASTTYTYTGYTTQIANGWTHNYGDTYVGRKGSNYTPDNGGLPTGNGNIFAAFQVSAKSKIRVVFVWTKTNGDLSGKSVALASLSEETYNKLVTASTGTGTDVKYSISDFSSSQSKAVAINRADANKEITFEFDDAVSAGYYAVYTASSINSLALIKKIIVVPTHTLTWDFDGGSSSATAGEDYTAGGDVAEGATITYPVASTMSKSGSEFNGWSSSATTMPTTNLTITAQWTAASSCAATIPGNITKGTASGGTGTITLTAGGDIASGDTWYWQDAADGTATNKGSGKTKNVSAAGTYYVRSYNTTGDCWSAAKSVTVAAEDLVTHYTITYSKGASGTGDAIANGDKVHGEDFTLSDATYSRDGYVQTGWATEDGGAKAYELGGTYSTDADEELFPFWTPVYTVTKGTHANGDFTISPASQVAGGTVTLDPTPADGFMFSAWEIVKTSDASATGITVTNKQFEMPAYGVTVNATFVADTRKKILYLTSATTEGDKLYEALKDDYNVTVAAPEAQTLTNYDLVVLHESIGGNTAESGNDSKKKQVILGIPTTTIPVLNTKSYFYTSARWNWGNAANGKKTKGVHVNTAYCNIASHPLFDGLTPDANDSIIILSSINGDNKPMQPVTSFTSGKEGYTLANVPDGCAIHELTPAQRGVASGKYLLISVYNKDLNNLNADGQKLFKNAADYLTSATTWTPVAGLTNAEIDATGNPFSEGATMTLTASATGATAATTYAWYKGATWSEAEAGGAIQAAKTAENSGHIYTKTAAAEDAGKYWCVMVKSTGCEVTASVEVSVLTCTKPEAPASLVASDIDYTSATLSWDPSGAGANGYKIALIKKDDESVILDWTDESTNSYSATGLTQGTEYTFKVKYKGDGITPGQCEFSNEVTVDFTTTAPSVADLVTIADDYTFTPNATIAAGTLAEDNKLFASGADDCDYNGSGMRIKENRALAFNVNNGAKVKVTFGTNGDREMKLGTAMTGDDSKVYGHSKTSPVTFDVTADGVVYLTSTSDLRFTKMEIIYPHTVTYDLNGGTGDPAPTQASKYVGETFTAHDGVTGITAPATKEFDKWVDQDAADVAGGTTYTMPAKNVTLTAQWRDVTVKYAVTYDLADYTAGVAPTETDKAEGDVFAIKAAPARDGYAFMGWLCDIDAQTYQATNNYTMTTAPTTFTAVWKQEFQVTFNLKGHGDPIAPQIVLDGGKVTKPTNPSEEGWAFGGWFKETTCVNEWNFASDVVTEDTELFAKWEDETTAIKLIVDDTPSGKKINDEAYYTGSPLTSVEISEVEYPCVKLAGGANATTAPYGAGQNDNRVIAYCATTTATKIQVIAYSSTTSARPYTISFVEEGQTADEADDNNVIVNLPTDKTIHTSDWYTFNSSNNRTIYITIPGNNGDYHFLQVKVIESGTPIKKAGDLGYSMNFNIGRPIGKKQVLHSNFEGFDFYANNDYKVLQSTSMVISNATNDYIKFHAAAPMTLAVTTENANSFYVTKNAKGTANETLSTAGGTSYIDLDAAADWYISPKGGDVKIQTIAFITPKCAEPAFNSLANSDICSGDPYVALNGTATVADAGVPTYKWYAEGADESDPAAVLATTATYTPSADGKYYVIAVNHLAGFSDNEKKSDLVTVTTHAGTAITEGLVDLRGVEDAVVTLTVTATGKALHYAWKESATIDGTYTDVAGAADAASLDVTITDGMSKYYKVVVSGGCGAAQESIAKVEEYVAVSQQDVTGSIVWDWIEAASVNEIKLTSGTTPKKNEGFVMANGAATIYNNANFESDKLYLEGEYIIRTEGGKLFQGQLIKFNTTKAGFVRVKFSNTGGNPARELYVNGVGTGFTSGTATAVTTELIEVPAGEVAITAYLADKSEDASQKYVRVYKVEFYELAHQRTSGYAAGDLGTVCLEDATIIDGANLYEIAGLDQYGYLAFDEIENGELEAGKPYLFEVTNPSKISFYKPVGAAHSDDAIAVKGMIGTFDGLTLTQGENNYYYFSGRHIWRVNDFTVSIPIPANRCYVDMDVLRSTPAPQQAAPGRRRVTLGVNGKNAPTAIDNAEATEAPRKVMINGNLYILRGEKMYDATGRLVK